MMMMIDSKPRAASPLAEALLAALVRHGPEKTLSAPELAQEIAPQLASGSDWHSLIMPIRHAAVELAKAGRLVIYRKGKPVDPSDFKGVYRLGLPRHD